MTVAAPASVLFVTSRWARDGGVGAHVQESARALAAHGVRVTVLTGRIEEQNFAPDVTVIASAELHHKQADMDARVGDALTCRAEVVHIHQLDDPALVGFMQTRAATVLSAHAYTACPASFYYFKPGKECARGRGPGCIGNMLFRGCMQTRNPRHLRSYAESGRALRALRQADLTISYSHFMDRYLAANAVTRRAVLPYFTTVEPCVAPGDRERRRVVFAGRIVKEKGVETLLRAAQGLDAELVICGDGRHLPAMRQLAHELGLAQRTHFLGWVSADELARELAEASVVALPSLWPEPFGLVGIEALAAGTPVVASDTGGVRDWLDDGVSGVVVPPGDACALRHALGELLADPQRQRAMGDAGRKTVNARFSREEHVARLLDGYRAARASWLVARAR